jgi:NAD(P)-dependent dehydrogenase (short-subunit alcohol dehydrogenase family)
MGMSNTKPIKYLPAFEADELPSLDKKVVVITGCTSGTGLVFAKVAVRKGAASVLLLNRPSDRATKAEEYIKAEIPEGSNTKVEAIPCDLQDFESVKAAAKTIKDKYDAVDVLCNNAGVMAMDDKVSLLLT